MGHNSGSNARVIRKKSIITIFLMVLTIFIFGLLFYKFVVKKSETYTVVNGYVEKSTNTQGIVIKQEEVIDLKNNNSVIPLVEQGKRVRKTESIAIYKDSKYQEYITKINDLDKQIEVLIDDLPQTYSNDISYIESQIEKLSKEAQNSTSYIKMQDYKSKIDNLSNKKITLLGEFSPAGSKVRELIETRKKVESDYINSSDNIKAPISGCVTYRIDGIEEDASFDQIFNYSSNDIDCIFEKYSKNATNDFGIKIVNNFISYIIIKTSGNEYMKEGNSYYLNFADRNGVSELATLIKVIRTENEQDNCYCIFKIYNGIEELVDSRCENVEVIWTKKSGMAIPLNAIKLYDNLSIGNVTILKNGDYITVPVKIIVSNENMAIVENLSNDEKEQNNIQNDYRLEIFDQLVKEE